MVDRPPDRPCPRKSKVTTPAARLKRLATRQTWPCCQDRVKPCASTTARSLSRGRWAASIGTPSLVTIVCVFGTGGWLIFSLCGERGGAPASGLPCSAAAVRCRFRGRPAPASGAAEHRHRPHPGEFLSRVGLLAVHHRVAHLQLLLGYPQLHEQPDAAQDEEGDQAVPDDHGERSTSLDEQLPGVPIEQARGRDAGALAGA